jgi:arylsulfatase
MSSTTQPNFVFVLPDQLRHDFLGCYGADFVETPHIDGIAAAGLRYDRAHSTSPICVPARAGLLTGRHALANGVTDNGMWLRPDLATTGVKTWPELLDEQGYLTAAIGKMHFYPWDARHGFRYRSVAEDKRWLHVRDDYYHFLRERGHRKYHGNEHEGYFENKGAIVNKLPWELTADHFVGSEACRFLRDYGTDGPFAMMVGFPGPHCPYDPTEEFLARVDQDRIPDAVPEVPGDAPRLRERNVAGNLLPWNGVDYSEFPDATKRKIRAHYAASVKQIDHEVGEILKTLDELGLAEKTVVVFSSDHGDHLGDHNLIGKGDFFDSSTHVPLLVRAPGATPRTNGDLVELGDVTATLLAFAGVKLPGYLDSIPLPGLGLPGSRRRDYTIGATSSSWMIQDLRWRLAKYATGETLLFDLENDPTEQHNLAASAGHRDKLLELDGLLTQEVMRLSTASHYPARVYTSDLSTDPSFGFEGWRRPYPRSFDAGGRET